MKLLASRTMPSMPASPEKGEFCETKYCIQKLDICCLQTIGRAGVVMFALPSKCTVPKVVKNWRKVFT